VTFNPRGSFTNDLSLFGSWVQDVPPADLPLGASPDNADCFYLPGSVFTRPALKAVLDIPVPENPTIVSNTNFALPAGTDLTMFLDSLGMLWSNDVGGSSGTLALSVVDPGVQFKAETAFSKKWFAFYSYLQSLDFSANPFVGVDVPLYYNGTKLYRVTSDAPGVGPVFGSLTTNQIPIATGGATPSPIAVSSYVTTGVAFDEDQNRYYTVIRYTSPVSVPTTWLNQTITVSGCGGFGDRTGPVTDISGNTFEIPFVTYAFQTNSGLSGTATGPTGSYNISRAANMVTLYFGATEPPNFTPGFWLNFQNADGSAINGPNWTITGISRDVSGLVTVTISTQLHNLAIGTVLFVASNDTSDFPSGFQEVTRVVSASGGTTVFCYQSTTTTIASDSSGGTVYQQWTPTGGTYGNAAQITAVGFDATYGNFVQFFQFGPDTSIGSTGGTAIAQIIAQAQAGQRSGVLIFASADGALTAPSVPIDLTTLGGNNLLIAQQIAIGPPGTSRRIIALTPASGANFYYITATQGRQIGNQDLIAATGTVVNDNTTTTAVFDFNDAQLVAGTQIDVAGNDLFNQIVLAPCLGVIEYDGRMVWWGEINNIKNLVNPGFDGGYLPPTGTCSVSGLTVTWQSGTQFQLGWSDAQIMLDGQMFTIAGVQSSTMLTLSASAGMPYGIIPFSVLSPLGALPLGWDASQGDSEGSLVTYTELSTEFGFAYQMKTGFNNHIQQGAAADFFGDPILSTSTSYKVRLKAKCEASNKSGVLVVDIYSATGGGIIASATFPLSLMSTTGLNWMVRDFVQELPASIPSDAILEVYLLSTVAGGLVTIDEIELIPQDRPVSFDQARVSYFQNPFGYDAISGLLGLDPSENITAAFRQRGYLYLNSDKSLFQSQNNGTGEPSTWNVIQYVGVCGCSGPNAVDFGEEFALWAGRYGIREFTGDPTAKKISQEFARTWESINWNAQTTIWLTNDPVDRLIFCGIPLDDAAMPSLLLQMSYRLNDAAYNVPDPVHVSQYSGKMIVTDLGRRWSPWQLPMNCGAMCVRPLPTGNAEAIVFGGGNGQAPGAAPGFGNLYTLDWANYWPLDNDVVDWNCLDADYGPIDAFYTTAFFFQKEAEQSPQVGNFRKIFNYLSIHATGVGQVKISPIIDALSKIQDPLPLTTLQLQDPGFDLEFHPITKGNRCAYRLSATNVYPSSKRAFAFSQMNVSGRKDLVFPIRGTVFGG
jgi:hypothetical protein